VSCFLYKSPWVIRENHSVALLDLFDLKSYVLPFVLVAPSVNPEAGVSVAEFSWLRV
jgi:hypothetical protein